MEKDPNVSVPPPTSSGVGFGKMFGSIGDKLHQMIDNDPELTRRTQIARLKDTITQVTLRKEEKIREGGWMDGWLD